MTKDSYFCCFKFTVAWFHHAIHCDDCVAPSTFRWVQHVGVVGTCFDPGFSSLTTLSRAPTPLPKLPNWKSKIKPMTMQPKSYLACIRNVIFFPSLKLQLLWVLSGLIIWFSFKFEWATWLVLVWQIICKVPGLAAWGSGEREEMKTNKFEKTY